MYADHYVQAVPPDRIHEAVGPTASLRSAFPRLALEDCAVRAVAQTFCGCVFYRDAGGEPEPPILVGPLIHEVIRLLRRTTRPETRGAAGRS